MPLGIASGRIPNNQMSASSSVDPYNMGPHRARLNLLPSDAGAGGWFPMNLNQNQFLQVDNLGPIP